MSAQPSINGFFGKVSRHPNGQNPTSSGRCVGAVLRQFFLGSGQTVSTIWVWSIGHWISVARHPLVPTIYFRSTAAPKPNPKLPSRLNGME